MDAQIQGSFEYVGVPVSVMDEGRLARSLNYLDDQGPFLIKKAGDKIAKSCDISKFTSYNYL